LAHGQAIRLTQFEMAPSVAIRVQKQLQSQSRSQRGAIAA